MRSLRTSLAAATLACATAGCSSSTFGLTPQPNGNIVITNDVTGAVLNTSLANPFPTGTGSFSIGLTEDHFGGPYTVVVNTWTAPFNIPCFVPHMISGQQQTNVVNFRADNGAPVGNPSQPSPCITGDTETALISDSKGHSVTFVYTLENSVTQQSAAHRLGLR